MFRYLLLAIILLINIFLGYSQNLISGSVKDSLGKHVSGTTIIIKNQNSGAIINYDISDSDGFFSIKIKSNLPNLLISASYLGYKTVNQIIENRTQNIKMVLMESPESLREVLVTSENIKKEGDTLSYSVSAFKDQKDRSIADVLKKMPGIDILPNGQITYMGKPIEKYYIEGMDLLEGRYNLANDNISADDVSKVQILENHQPIKVLDSLVFSDKTSLNIKLKNNISITGTAEIATGFSPILLKTNLTPLVFTKKSQALISYQYNNTGNDLARSNNDFSTSDNSLEGFNASKKNILSIQVLSRPPFSSDIWLDNNDHFATVNYLYRLKNKTDLKINLSYLNGVRKEMGRESTTYITDSNIINYREEVRNTLFLNSLDSKFTLEKNLSKSYLRNTASVKAFWDSQRGNIYNGNTHALQELSNPYFVLTNDFKGISPIGKELVTFNSSSGYTNSEQKLLISPGQFEDILNNNQSYESTKQDANITTLYSENKAGFTKQLGAFTVSSEIGVAYRNQNLSSNLSKTVFGSKTQIVGNYLNDLQQYNTTLFFSNQFNFKKKKWTIVFRSPIYFRSIATENNLLNEQKNIRKLNFEPDLMIIRKLSPYWEVSVRGNIENRFGEIDRLYNGFILNNYLSLVRYNSILMQNADYFSRLNIKYRDALKAIFANLSFAFTSGKRNLLYNTSVDDNGALIVESSLQNNETTTRSLDLNASKYFSKIKTTIKIKTGLSISNNPQILNGQLGSFKNIRQNYHLDTATEVTKWFSFNSNSTITSSSLSATDNQSIKVANWQNSIALYFYLSEHDYFNVDAEQYYNFTENSDNTNYFLNLKYQFTIKKYNLDASLVWRNILNTKDYLNVLNNQFFSNENSYIIRPSQLLISFKFSL